jgi:FixJ family two-component response regulator
MLAGKFNRMIATELSISVRTVEKHRENLMDKLGVDSLAQLVRLIVLHQNHHCGTENNLI